MAAVSQERDCSTPVSKYLATDAQLSQNFESSLHIKSPEPVLESAPVSYSWDTTCAWDRHASNQRFHIPDSHRSMVRLESPEIAHKNKGGASSKQPSFNSLARCPTSAKTHHQVTRGSIYDAFDASINRHERDTFAQNSLPRSKSRSDPSTPRVSQHASATPQSQNHNHTHTHHRTLSDQNPASVTTTLSLGDRARALSTGSGELSKKNSKNCVAVSEQVFRAGARYRITCVFRTNATDGGGGDAASTDSTFISLTTPPFFYSTRVIGFVRVSDVGGQERDNNTSWGSGRQPRTMYQRTLRWMARPDEGKCYWVFDLLHSAWMRRVSDSSPTTSLYEAYRSSRQAKKPDKTSENSTILFASALTTPPKEDPSPQGKETLSKVDSTSPRKQTSTRLPKDASRDQAEHNTSKVKLSKTDTSATTPQKAQAVKKPTSARSSVPGSSNAWKHGDVFTLELDFTRDTLDTNPCTPKGHGMLTYIYNGESYPGFLPAIKPPVKFALSTCTPADEFEMLHVVEF